MEAREREAVYFEYGGRCPVREWMASITDKRLASAVDARITRLQLGAFGDSKPIGEGASESRIHYQDGARVYYGVDGEQIVLLHGAEKSNSQDSDIRTALANWKIHKERKKRERK